MRVREVLCRNSILLNVSDSYSHLEPMFSLRCIPRVVVMIEKENYRITQIAKKTDTLTDLHTHKRTACYLSGRILFQLTHMHKTSEHYLPHK